ncbi:hypothetical protein Pcinc_040671 [Petrolisthes cinctipes]|uniref:Uncharacterized protein n=1 Tax=Petrolisthes cinctipes TaxID=88211 RepID=A0AAE1BME9_PETCI|nr:hypothetical protein Pcinc_040671 [Petrolisthes cinctipes]
MEENSEKAEKGDEEIKGGRQSRVRQGSEGRRSEERFSYMRSSEGRDVRCVREDEKKDKKKRGGGRRGGSWGRKKKRMVKKRDEKDVGNKRGEEGWMRVKLERGEHEEE